MTTVITLTVDGKASIVFEESISRFMESWQDFLCSKYKVESRQTKEIQQLELAKVKYPEMICIIEDKINRLGREEGDHNPKDLKKAMTAKVAAEYKFFDSKFYKYADTTWSGAECRRLAAFMGPLYEEWATFYPGFAERMPHLLPGLQRATSATISYRTTERVIRSS